MKPVPNKLWKLILRFKTGKNGTLKIDDLGTCGFHTTNIDDACQRTFTMQTEYQTVS